MLIRLAVEQALSQASNYGICEQLYFQEGLVLGRCVLRESETRNNVLPPAAGDYI